MSIKIRSSVRALFVLVAASATAIASCSSDPVHDAYVKSLGPEAGDVAPGEYHRAGQPCLVCHGGKGPADAEFTMAGTVFYGQTNIVGYEDIEVLMVDSAGTSPLAPVKTNCVGNFFIRKEVWEPQYPVGVQVARGTDSRRMASQISRDGSCAGCHKLGAGYDSPGHVFLKGAGTDANPTLTKCDANPRPTVN